MKVIKRIPANGEISEIIEDMMTFEQAQKYVGGYVQVLKSTIPKHNLVTNEDGNMQGLPVNVEATKLLHPMYGRQDIVGNVLLIKGNA